MTDIPSDLAPTRALRDEYMAMVQRRRLYSFVLLVVFIALIVAGFDIAENRNAGAFWDGVERLPDYPTEILTRALEQAPGAIWANISWLSSIVWNMLPALVETINIAAVSTLIGAIAAIFLSLLSTRGLARWPWAVPIFRRSMDIMRAVPEIVIALVLVFVLGGGPVPAMIAIAFHTAGALGKLFSEVNENADLKPVEGLSSVGAGWMQRMWLGVIPQVAPNYLSYGLLRLEINVRASAILGFVGSGGIGAELRVTLSQEWRNDEALMIFVLLFLTIVAFDQFSSWGRNRLIGQRG